MTKFSLYAGWACLAIAAVKAGTEFYEGDQREGLSTLLLLAVVYWAWIVRTRKRLAELASAQATLGEGRAIVK